MKTKTKLVLLGLSISGITIILAFMTRNPLFLFGGLIILTISVTALGADI